MNKEEILDTLSEETKRKLAACKTPEEARRVLTEADEVATLDDGMMEAIAGGGYGPGFYQYQLRQQSQQNRGPR